MTTIAPKLMFNDVIPEAEMIAARLSKKYKRRFEIWELINEAWLRSNDKSYDSKKLFLKRIKWDMMAYIRDQLGHRLVKAPPLELTGFDSMPSHNGWGEHAHNVLHRSYEDPSFEAFDNKELIELLLYEPSPRRLEAISLRFFEGLSFKEVGKQMGIAECSAYTMVKKGLTQCHDKVEEMELTYV